MAVAVQETFLPRDPDSSHRSVLSIPTIGYPPHHLLLSVLHVPGRWIAHIPLPFLLESSARQGNGVVIHEGGLRQLIGLRPLCFPQRYLVLQEAEEDQDP